MSGSREEERRKLADIINHWNANRLDLFEISQPTEVRTCVPGTGGLQQVVGGNKPAQLSLDRSTLCSYSRRHMEPQHYRSCELA
ncbi:hypothetical protein FKM82_025376 [Ascaphus truei]